MIKQYEFKSVSDILCFLLWLEEIFFKIIIDIEHDLKIRLLNLIENIADEDGYKIVNLYLEKDFNEEKFPKKVHNSIFKKSW